MAGRDLQSLTYTCFESLGSFKPEIILLKPVINLINYKNLQVEVHNIDKAIYTKQEHHKFEIRVVCKSNDGYAKSNYLHFHDMETSPMQLGDRIYFLLHDLCKTN